MMGREENGKSILDRVRTCRYALYGDDSSYIVT